MPGPIVLPKEKWDERGTKKRKERGVGKREGEG